MIDLPWLSVTDALTSVAALAAAAGVVCPRTSSSLTEATARWPPMDQRCWQRTTACKLEASIQPL